MRFGKFGHSLATIAFFFSVLSLAAGCVESDNSDTTQLATHRAEIKGGVQDQTSSFAVGIFAAGGICSGTLIAPNLVLTAQHCVARVTSEYVVCGEAGFGSKHSPSNVYVTTDPAIGRRGNYFRASEIFVPPGGSDMCGFDIALIILDENIPSTFATPVIPRIDIAPFHGENYTAIGYGHIGDDSGSGVRRRLENREVQCSGDCPSYTSVQVTEFLGSDGTCQGDSGGTALDGQNRVLGALSRGPSGCGDAVYSGVSGWANWLREVGEDAALRGEYDPHFWVTHGVSEIPADDLDLDGFTIDLDNCPDVENPEQIDSDGDGQGDQCDADIDGDQATNDTDNCPMTANETQEDLDADGLGDECDDDVDGDGVENSADNCAWVPNSSQDDSDGNGLGDVCEPVVEILDEGGCSSTGGNTDLGALFLGLLGIVGLTRRRRKL